MANFKTHILVATVLSGALAVGGTITGLASPVEAVCYWLAGSLGGLLPDIDSDESVALRIVFRLFGALVAGLLVVYCITRLPNWQVLGLAASGYLIARYPLLWVFARLTVHRGLLHSLLANLLFGLVTVVLTHHLLSLNAHLAWGIGGFVIMGATVHLLLDEMYSVDLSGMRIKRSFGTALKLADRKQPGLSLLMLMACIGALWLSPSTASWEHSLGVGLPPWPSLNDAMVWLQQSLLTLRQALA
jgi:membrane-bound metal-dependent hydrolase YbcI (DUF457 family)